MKKAVFIALCCLLLPLSAHNQVKTKVLFVYDSLNERNESFISTVKDALNKENIDVKEWDLKANKRKEIDLTAYDYLLIYGEVRAFSPRIYLRRWLRRNESFHSKKIGLYVTGYTPRYSRKIAARLKKIITCKNGQVVDAITSATAQVSEDRKQQAARHFAQDFIEVIKLEK